MSDRDKINFLINHSFSEKDVARKYDEETMPMLDNYEHRARVSQAAHHIKMFEFVVKQSTEVAGVISESEKSKKRWRTTIMIVLLGLLGFTFFLIYRMLDYSMANDTEFPVALLIGLFSTAIIQIVAMLTLFIKFITNTESLEMYKVITHKFLDYLGQYNSVNNRDKKP